MLSDGKLGKLFFFHVRIKTFYFYCIGKRAYNPRKRNIPRIHGRRCSTWHGSSSTWWIHNRHDMCACWLFFIFVWSTAYNRPIATMVLPFYILAGQVCLKFFATPKLPSLNHLVFLLNIQSLFYLIIRFNTRGPATTDITTMLFAIGGFLYLGFIVDFISFPIISGFTSAAAITIAVGQVKVIFTFC